MISKILVTSQSAYKPGVKLANVFISIEENFCIQNETYIIALHAHLPTLWHIAVNIIKVIRDLYLFIK